MMRIFNSCICWLCISAVLWGQEALSTKEQMLRQAQRCRQLLESSVTQFYLPGCLDTKNGGYLENWGDGKFFGNGEKFLTQQARTLWFFSTLVQKGINVEAAKSASKAGFDFLQAKF